MAGCAQLSQKGGRRPPANAVARGTLATLQDASASQLQPGSQTRLPIHPQGAACPPTHKASRHPRCSPMPTGHGTSPSPSAWPASPAPSPQTRWQPTPGLRMHTHGKKGWSGLGEGGQGAAVAGTTAAVPKGAAGTVFCELQALPCHTAHALTALASPGRRPVRLVLTLRPDASSNACTISSTVVPAGQGERLPQDLVCACRLTVHRHRSADGAGWQLLELVLVLRCRTTKQKPCLRAQPSDTAKTETHQCLCPGCTARSAARASPAPS